MNEETDGQEVDDTIAALKFIRNFVANANGQGLCEKLSDEQLSSIGNYLWAHKRVVEQAVHEGTVDSRKVEVAEGVLNETITEAAGSFESESLQLQFVDDMKGYMEGFLRTYGRINSASERQIGKKRERPRNNEDD